MRHRHEALLSALGMITGLGDLRGAALMLPGQTTLPEEIAYNPDLHLFDLRSKQLEMSKDLLKSQRMPKAFGFAQLGYGNPPGTNFFSETADAYYSVGAGLKWNIWDWRRNSNERQSLTLQQQLTDIRKSAAEEGLERLLTLKRAEIASLREAAESDDILISARTRIAAVSASQLENGTVTAAQYITDLNSEKQAVINAGLRRINIARAEAEYINITGRK
jgi:outer membrane protein TolC